MTDPSTHPDDEIVSAYLDGTCTDDERARVEADARLQARLATFARIRDRLADVEPVPAERRDAHVAAALAVSDGGAGDDRAADATVLDLTAERSRRRGGVVLAAAAAAVVVLVGVGLVRSGLGGDAEPTADVAQATAAGDSSTEDSSGAADGDLAFSGSGLEEAVEAAGGDRVPGYPVAEAQADEAGATETSTVGPRLLPDHLGTVADRAGLVDALLATLGVTAPPPTATYPVATAEAVPRSAIDAALSCATVLPPTAGVPVAVTSAHLLDSATTVGVVVTDDGSGPRMWIVTPPACTVEEVTLPAGIVVP